MNKIILILLYLVFYCTSSFAQMNATDSFIRANSYTIHLKEDGTLAGDGVAFILKRTMNAQFVLIGENHNTKEIPEFTTALFKILNKTYGFKHLALEQDPPMMHRVSSSPYKGNTDSICSLARRYPYGFTFISDEELKMIAGISKYPAKGNVIWGCDQSFGATHVITKIKEKNKNRLLDTLLNKANKIESTRDIETKHFLSQDLKKSDLDYLSQFKIDNPANEIDFEIGSLVISDSIFSFMTHKKTYEGCALREQYMKSRFLEEYRLCINEGEKHPKVLLKLGTSHIMDGFEPNTGVLNLGTFVKEFAIANGYESFSINARIYRTDTSDYNFNLYEGKNIMNIFARNAPVNDWTLFDLKPIKSLYYNSKMKDNLTKEDRDFFENHILVYDALLMIGNGGDGTFNTCKCND